MCPQKDKNVQTETSPKGQKEQVIVICGPTASGKTGLSIELAKKNKWRNSISRFNANI